jgi:uncharacterized repeat protein (TIGR03847 family)
MADEHPHDEVEGDLPDDESGDDLVEDEDLVEEEDEDDELDDDAAIEAEEDETVIDLSELEALAGSAAGELLAAFEGTADDDEDGPDTLQVRLSPGDARLFVGGALAVVAAGRLPCPLCGQPLDPGGHICPRRNGHYVN